MNIIQFIIRNAEQYPDKTALIYENEKLTYSEMLETCNNLANSLLDLGIKRGNKLIIISKNSIEYLTIVFSCARINCVLVNLNYRLSALELYNIIRENEPSLIFFDYRLLSLYKEICLLGPLNAEVVSLGGLLDDSISLQKIMEGKPNKWNEQQNIDSSLLPVMQYYTSGTTGHPKGVIHSHHSIILHTLINSMEGEYNYNTIYQYSSPMFHSAIAGAFNTMAVGGSLVILSEIKAESFLSSIEMHDVNYASISPYIMQVLVNYNKFHEYDLSRLKRINYANSTINPSVLDYMIDEFPNCRFIQFYGMTEMGPVVSVLKPKDHENVVKMGVTGHRYSVGKPALMVDLKIVREDGNECRFNEIGEIVVRSPTMMLGYVYKNKIDNSAIEKGWYYTGDIGYYDKDSFLFIVGRKDDMIVSGGENIHCSEIERCLNKIEDIEQAVAIGIPDPTWNERMIACVVLKLESKIENKGILEICKQELGYKSPKQIFIVDNFPRNANGKIDKLKLKEEVGI